MSTAKSMATLYLNGKRNGTLTAAATTTSQRFKSSTSNLAQSTGLRPSAGSTKTRLKSTSMTNLVAGQGQLTGDQQQQQQQQLLQVAGKMQRPVSRNALDSIHNGMNAKYAQVQSKVYLQNIKPSLGAAGQQQSKIPGSKTLVQHQQQQQQQQPQQQQDAAPTGQPAGSATATKATKLKGPAAIGSSSKTSALANERSLLAAKLKLLEDELASQQTERETLRQELAREKGEKGEQVQQLKVELQEKLAEHDRQNEEYHKKLLEAYELADQNRRAADSILSESRQRDEESRKRIELLESELNELKEFVSMKEEMMGKMYELREQLRQERERYEEQLKSLHQVFENEKISHEEEQLRLLEAGKQHSMLLHSRNSIKLDENSNSLYFSRMKPALESSESINKPNAAYMLPTTGGCRQCQSGSSQLHKSEQDIYGSKMSTRMQDTANRAWKASRKFASSVITGGVNLSACRQCTKGGGSNSPPGDRKGRLQSGQSVAKYTCTPPTATPTAAAATTTSAPQEPDEAGDGQHTSVIRVGSMNLAEETAQQQQRSPAPQRLRSAASRQQQQPSVVDGAGDTFAEDSQPQHHNHQQQQLGSLIKVDGNNKLTIVTKFNDSECHNSNEPGAMGASSSVSERSRCESSSSGRGTSSDAGSAASQNGDDLEANNNNNTNTNTNSVNRNKRKQGQQQPPAGQPDDGPQGPIVQQAKGHRRRSSLFKAGKILGGSQASLHRLKSLFQTTGASKGPGKQTKADQQKQQQVVSLDHLEASRLRCMELNQAISVTSVGATSEEVSREASASPSGGGLHNESKDELKWASRAAVKEVTASSITTPAMEIQGQGAAAAAAAVNGGRSEFVDKNDGFRPDLGEAAATDTSRQFDKFNTNQLEGQQQLEQQPLSQSAALRVAQASS